MGAVSLNDVDNYGGSGGAGYFSLKNDKDTAVVQFLYETAQDVTGTAVHEVEINGKKRYVNCLRAYNEPLDKCPFCEAGKFQRVKFFVPVFDTRDNKVKIWERGRKFASKLASLCARYSPLKSHLFEIERNGKIGDTSTTYEIYELQDKPNWDTPEMPEIIGGIVLDKSADEMKYYLQVGEFQSEESAMPIRRGTTDTGSVRRRTPVSNGDTF